MGFQSSARCCVVFLVVQLCREGKSNGSSLKKMGKLVEWRCKTWAVCPTCTHSPRGLRGCLPRNMALSTHVGGSQGCAARSHMRDHHSRLYQPTTPWREGKTTSATKFGHIVKLHRTAVVIFAHGNWSGSPTWRPNESAQLVPVRASGL